MTSEIERVKMKKLMLVSVIMALFGAFAADDSFLYWMVDANATGTQRGGQPLEGGGPYTAKIAAFAAGSEWSETGATYLDIWGSTSAGVTDARIAEGDVGVSGINISSGASLPNAAYFAKVADGSATDWTYFVELYNDGGTVVAHSDALSYSSEYFATVAGMGTPGGAWVASSFVAAPEPNSALLLLIGCATLALRRRKQIVA